MLPQWHVKDTGHSAKSAGGRLHLNTHTPWIQRSRSGLTMLPSRCSEGTCQETSSHATRQGNTQSQSSQLATSLWTDPGLKSGISVRKLIPRKKKCRRGMNGRTPTQNLRKRAKRYHRLRSTLPDGILTRTHDIKHRQTSQEGIGAGRTTLEDSQ